MKVTRLFSLFMTTRWPVFWDDPCSEAKSFHFCVILGCIVPGHASEKSHGCLGYRTEYALSCLIGRFTAHYGNPYEQTSTMESHKFSCWLIWRNSAVFCQAKPFIGQEIFPVIQHMDTNVFTLVHMLDHRKYFLANKGFGLRKQRCFVRWVHLLHHWMKTTQAELFEKASDMWDLKHQIWKKTFARILSKILYFYPFLGKISNLNIFKWVETNNESF